MGILNLVSLIGLAALGVLAWAAGGFRRPVPWRTVLGSGALMFGLAGSSPAAVAIVLVIFVGIILLCGAIYPILAYPFAYAAENPLIVLVPGVVFTLLVIYFPFRQYGLLLSRLADAIDSFTKPADTPFA